MTLVNYKILSVKLALPSVFQSFWVTECLKVFLRSSLNTFGKMACFLAEKTALPHLNTDITFISIFVPSWHLITKPVLVYISCFCWSTLCRQQWQLSSFTKNKFIFLLDGYHWHFQKDKIKGKNSRIYCLNEKVLAQTPRQRSYYPGALCILEFGFRMMF